MNQITNVHGLRAAAKRTSFLDAVVRSISRKRLGFLGWAGFVLLAFAGLAHAAETVTYYYTDQQGTVLATADAAGNILSTTDYRPYGAVARGTPEEGPGYTGHVDDTDTGLVYMQARYYDAVVGRFIGADPAGSKSGSVLSFGLYSYASSNPIGNVDLDGRQSVPLVAYSQYWPGSEQQKQEEFIGGMAGTFVSIVTQSNVFDVAPAGSGSGAVASSGLPGEFLLAGGVTRGAGMLASMGEAAPEIAGEELAGLPRMRVADITAKGSRVPNYAINWTKGQFEDHLSANGYTMEIRGRVNVWLDQDGVKAFTTRDFSKSGGPTGEMFHSSGDSFVAKFRFDQNFKP